MKVKMWCCTTCGGGNVMRDAWVACNDPDDVRTFDATFCEDCDGPCNIEPRMVDEESDHE